MDISGTFKDIGTSFFTCGYLLAGWKPLLLLLGGIKTIEATPFALQSFFGTAVCVLLQGSRYLGIVWML